MAGCANTGWKRSRPARWRSTHHGLRAHVASASCIERRPRLVDLTHRRRVADLFHSAAVRACWATFARCRHCGRGHAAIGRVSMRVSGRSASRATVLNARPSSEEGSLDEGRNRRRRLQLNVPLRTGDGWTNRVVLNLQLEQRRQASAFAHLAHLWPDPERPSLASSRLPIDRKSRLRPQGPPVFEQVRKVEGAAHLVGVPPVSADLEPLLYEAIADEVLAE